MPADPQLTNPIERVKHIPILPTLLDVVCQTTGMGFAAVACVTPHRWIACQVHDKIAFGLVAGGELPIETTLCQQIQDTHHPLIIEHVQQNQTYCHHPTPLLYGFQSYIAFPIFLPSGEFFGTLCAIDPQPAQLDNPKIRGLFTAFTELIAFHIQQLDALEQTQATLTQQIIAHQAMEQAAQALQQADRRKNEFLAMLAHELRNPLATLRSGLQLLTLVPEPAQIGQATLPMLTRQTDHLVRLVDDLLEVSRLSHGKIVLQQERVDLGELVSQAAQDVEFIVAEKGHRLHLELPSSPLYVAGDPVRLTQVVTNLLINSARYTAPGGQVWLSLEPAGQQALIQVRDTGIGLTAEQRAAIFELFVQVDNSMARSAGGLGLGLTLVRQLVEQHGGRVEVQSEGLGKGSTFGVRLPVLTDPVPSPPPAAPSSLAGLRLLVVDDNPDAATTLSWLLKRVGVTVHTAHSGAEALAATPALGPAVVLLDIGMPAMDGYETCQALRQQVGGPERVILALSGYGQAEDQQRSRAAGFDGHLVKPVELAQLTRVITHLLAGRKAHSGPAREPS